MLTIKNVKEELSEIRHFYSKKEEFERFSRVVGKPEVCGLVEKYNAVIRRAPIRLYDLYVSLYVKDNTQSAVAVDWKVGTDYVRQLNRKLCDFFIKEFNKEG